MLFRGYFHEPIFPRVTGFNKQGGEFWIGFINDDDTTDGMVRIELTIPADDSPSNNIFASIHVHHDGVKVLRKLSEIGFFDLFEEIQASTFYDVVQCCARCDIPIMYHGEKYQGDDISPDVRTVISYPFNETRKLISILN